MVTSCKGQSYKGTEFWFGLLENLFPSKSIQLMVIADEAATVNLDVPAQGFATSYAVNKGSNIFTLNKSVLYPTAGAGIVDDKGAHIISNKPVKIYILNEDAFSSDATAIIPFSRILKGEKYIVQSLPGSTFDGSSFLIVSTQDNAEYDITPSVKTASGFNANSTVSVTLDRGETLLVKADNEGDLSGSTVVSKKGCEAFVVFTGSKCSQSEYNSGSCTGCDHLYEQLLPVSHYGTQFYLAPFAAQPGNYVAKITASQDNTDVLIDGIWVANLNKNQSFPYRPVAPAFKKTCIQTSKPTLVYQYMNSKGCNMNPNGNGDPSMLLIPSKDKWVRDAQFGIFNTGNVDIHHINIVAKKSTLRNIQVTADVPFTKSFDTTLLCDDVGVLMLSTIQGDFEIRSDSDFYAYVYSIGINESFAYLTGANVFPFNGDYQLQGQQICFDAQPVNLGISSDSLTISSWNMGDGATYGAQSKVSHTYNTSGAYEVLAGVKLKSNTCPTDTLTIPITILPSVTFNGIKDNIICPGEKITYQLSAGQPLTYTWQDNTVGSTREVSNPGKYIVTATDTNACFATDSFTISDSGCFDKDLKIYNTITPNKDGFNDVWEVKHQGYAEITYLIFDRWGKEVFSGDVLKAEWWDGTLKDAEVDCAEGTYFYRIQAQVKRTGTMEVVSGIITLIR